MFVKVKLPETAKDKISDSYINSDRIIEVFYSITDKEYLAIVESPLLNPETKQIERTTATYAIEQADYNKIINKKKILKE